MESRSNIAALENRILRASMACIERRGLDELEIGEVAAKATVERMLVRRIYRTKAELVRATLSFVFGKLLAESATHVMRTQSSRRECLSSLLAYLISGSMRYPRLASALLHCPSFYLAVGPSPAERLSAVVFEATRDLAHELGVQDEDVITMRAALLVAAILSPLTEPGLFGAGMGIPGGMGSSISVDGQETFAALLAAILATDAAAAFEREAASAAAQRTLAARAVAFQQ
jgi:AcrR family transcriptional regulator